MVYMEVKRGTMERNMDGWNSFVKVLLDAFSINHLHKNNIHELIKYLLIILNKKGTTNRKENISKQLL